MKNKLIFRILGALASALIIVSVFIPFVSVLGYTQSLWEAYKASEALYLPIMIIVFGGIGVLFFSINIKTEFAYSTSGALLFYTITETVSFVNQDMLDSLGVGYYCLIKANEEISMLNQIDKLYDEQNTNNFDQNINSLDNVIQPLPIANIQPVMQPQETQPIMQPQIVEQAQPLSNLGSIENNSVEQQSTSIPEPTDEINVIAESQVVQENQSTVEPVTPQVVEQAQPLSNIGNVEVNQPSVQSVSISQMVNSENNVPMSNPVVAEFEVPTDNVVEQTQPFFTAEPQNNVTTPVSVAPQLEQSNLFAVNKNAIESNNPVVSEFTNQPNKILSNQELPTINNVNVPTSNNSNLDIFN